MGLFSRTPETVRYRIHYKSAMLGSERCVFVSSITDEDGVYKEAKYNDLCIPDTYMGLAVRGIWKDANNTFPNTVLGGNIKVVSLSQRNGIKVGNHEYKSLPFSLHIKAFAGDSAQGAYSLCSLDIGYAISTYRDLYKCFSDFDYGVATINKTKINATKRQIQSQLPGKRIEMVLSCTDEDILILDDIGSEVVSTTVTF